MVDVWLKNSSSGIRLRSLAYSVIMDVTPTVRPNSEPPRSISAGFMPLLRELSSSFTSLGLQKRVEDDSIESEIQSEMEGVPSLRTPLSISNASILERNPQVSCISYRRMRPLGFLEHHT